MASGWTHTHMHTHTHAHARTHAHTHTQTHKHIHTYILWRNESDLKKPDVRRPVAGTPGLKSKETIQAS